MRLLSTDIDGTVFEDTEMAQLFFDCWASLKAIHPNALLAYNTGRALDDVNELLRAQPLPPPDFLICGVGTVIYDPHSQAILEAWGERLSDGWDYHAAHCAVATSTPATPQPPECQGPHKSSWFWKDADHNVVQSLVSQLAQEGIDAQAVYSSNRDLDLLPASANKGNALAWLAAHLGIPTSDVIVAGDSANDSSMFLTPDVRGIAVANAEPALLDAIPNHPRIFRASLPCARGVAQGLDHFLSTTHNGPHEST